MHMLLHILHVLTTLHADVLVHILHVLTSLHADVLIHVLHILHAMHVVHVMLQVGYWGSNTDVPGIEAGAFTSGHLLLVTPLPHSHSPHLPHVDYRASSFCADSALSF